MECAAVRFTSLGFWVAVLLSWTSGQSPQQQTVTTTIVSRGGINVTIGNASVVRINCVVNPGNTNALVTWKFNGLVLARSGKYDIITSSNNDLTSLIVRNISVDDDGMYGCIIVGTLSFKAWSSTVNLTVLAPPQSVKIVGYESLQVVVVPYGADFVNLTCQVTGAKPAAELQWLRGGDLLSSYIAADSISADVNGKTFTTTKDLSIPQPGRELNKMLFTCVVNQLALTDLGRYMNVSRSLSVYYPPGAPQITGYQDQIMRPGDTLMVTCTSYDGNPQPYVHWYKNGLPFVLTYISNEDRRTVTSQLVTTVNTTDNDAIFRCEVKNDAIGTPLYNEIKLNVKFAPSAVVISGNTKLRARTTVTLTCTSSNSNPAAEITWIVRSHIIQNATSQVDPSPFGGFITTSNITLPIVQADDQVMYTCQATNSLLGQSVFTSALLEVFYPPGKPEIKGYNETGFILYKTVVRLTCTTIGGRPDPTLTWYKGATQLNTKPQKLLGTITTSEIEFIAQPDDNLALFRCTASNEATDVPLETSVQLKIYFPPQNVTIAVQQFPVREGVPVAVICDSGASNPAPSMWWIRGSSNYAGNDNGTRPADYNGVSRSNWYVMTPTKDDDGTKISCTAKNMEIGESMTTGLTLDVHHKPYFPASIFASTVQVALGTNVSVNFTPIANPPATDFKWYKLPDATTPLASDAAPFLAVGGYLTAINIARTNAGTYRVVATNTEGSNSFDFIFDVKYAAVITKTGCVANDAGGAVCTCTADANPQVDNMVVWKGKEGYNMTVDKTQAYASGTATLTIFDVKMEDIGDFQCVADNKLGEPATQAVTLLVPIRPVISREQQYSKAALTADGSSAIYCYITSYPQPSVTWTHNGAAVNLLSGKFSSAVNLWGDSKFTFRAELTLKGGNQSDFGSYACQASTVRGNDTWSVLLQGTSVPGSPYDIKVLNVTSNSIIISWTPGFDGGLPQHFVVRYRAVKADSRGYNYVDAYTPAYYEILKLNPSTTYEITAAGANSLGIGAYQNASVSATTLVDPSIKEAAADEDVTLIIILCVVIVGVIFLVLNAFLIVLFIRRKRRLLLDENASQVNTLELYGTTDMSGLGETDEAKSYTTYEKSVDCDDEYKHYEDDDDDDDDEVDARKGSRYGPPPGTYLIDDAIIPPPPQPWAKADTASHNPYGYGTYSNQPLVDNSQDLTPDGYAMELRSIGRTLPLASQMTDTHRRSRPSFVAGRPPAPPPPMLQQLPPQMRSLPPAEDGNASEAPPLPIRHYSQDEAQADNFAYAVSPAGRTFDGSAGAAGFTANDDIRGHLV